MANGSTQRFVTQVTTRPKRLHGVGTNAGLQRMAGLESGVTAKALAYVRRRYISVDALRRAIAIIADGTLRVRNPAIWGAGTVVTVFLDRRVVPFRSIRHLRLCGDCGYSTEMARIMKLKTLVVMEIFHLFFIAQYLRYLAHVKGDPGH